MKKYEVIINDVIERIKKGELKKGDKLPSIRKLSQQYACNKDTVVKSLNQLKRQHLLYAVEKSGYYVLTNAEQRTEQTDFDSAYSDYLQFPFGDFMTCMNEVLNIKNSYIFGYYPNQQGLSELVDSINGLLSEYSVYSSADRIAITSGTQQALYVLATINAEQNKNVILLEQPTYNRMNALVKSLALPYRTIDRTLEGIDLNQLESHFASGEIKYFYTIPRLHNPLGVSFKESEKEKIVELAARYDVYIVEDDYMADFDTNKSAPLHYYDIDDRVIYIKSFSSVIFPALRISVVALPEKLKAAFLKSKNLMDYDTNLIVQKALSLYIDNGMYNKHRQRLISLYAQKNIELKNILSRSIASNYTVFDTKTIFELKSRHKISTLKKALYPNYKIDFMEDAYIDSCPYQYVKIDVRNMNISDIEQNVTQLLALLQHYIAVL